MNKQEFLATSLPYNLICKEVDLNEEFRLNPKLYSLIELLNWSNVYQPILRPLSDLTKEIEHKGAKIVPIDYLWFMVIGTDSDWMSKEDFYELIESGYTKLYPFCVVQHLIEWHFDIADLISKGEAIDVNILEINPYK